MILFYIVVEVGFLDCVLVFLKLLEFVIYVDERDESVMIFFYLVVSNGYM